MTRRQQSRSDVPGTKAAGTARAADATFVAGKDVPEGLTHSESMATIMAASAMPVVVMRQYSGDDRLEASDLLAEVRRQAAKVNRGDLRQLETMLLGQALALETMFTDLAHRARLQEGFKAMEAMTRLALKAQAQSRATVEAIGNLRNPVQLIRQANFAQGHQQVINEAVVPPPRTQRARKNRSAPNELLETRDGQWLDAGAQGPASSTHPNLEAVGARHRAEDQ